MGWVPSDTDGSSALDSDRGLMAAMEFATAAIERLVVRHRNAMDVTTSVSSETAIHESEQRFADCRSRFLASLSEPSAFSALVRTGALSEDEAGVLAVLLACETDGRLQSLLVHVNSDPQRVRIENGTLEALFDPPHMRSLAVGEGGGLRRCALVTIETSGPWSRHQCVLASGVIAALAGEPSLDTDLPYRADVVQLEPRPEGTDFVVVTGPDAVRRREVALRSIGGSRLLRSPVPSTDKEWEAVVREATLLNAVVYLDVEESLSDVGRRWIDRARHLRFVLSSVRPLATEELPRRDYLQLEALAADPSDDEWASAFGDTPRTHRLTPEQLEAAARRFEANGRDLDLTVRRLVSARLDQLTRRVRPARDWSELVLPAEQRTLLGDMVERYRHSGLVFDDWGFPASPSRGLVLLFSGPSGTGKTLAAEVMAGALGLDLYRLDLSSIVSKYIGETEKNLDEVFDAAGAGNLVLFFDEADSLFGKRSEVKDARDRYANIEVSYLLQRLERYDGVVILATNFEKNIDDAFLRRIHARIDFALPSVEQRSAIWRQHLPESAPLDGDPDLDALAARFELSGGSIRNAAVNAAFFAAREGTSLSMRHLILGVERELRKQGRLIKPDDFPEVYGRG